MLRVTTDVRCSDPYRYLQDGVMPLEVCDRGQQLFGRCRLLSRSIVILSQVLLEPQHCEACDAVQDRKACLIELGFLVITPAAQASRYVGIAQTTETEAAGRKTFRVCKIPMLLLQLCAAKWSECSCAQQHPIIVVHCHVRWRKQKRKPYID